MFILVSTRSGRSLGLPAYRDLRAARLAASAFASVMGEGVTVRRTGSF